MQQSGRTETGCMDIKGAEIWRDEILDEEFRNAIADGYVTRKMVCKN
jgi:hypothetical protein